MDIGYSAGSYDHGKMRWALVLASASIGPRKRKSALWLHVRDYEYALATRLSAAFYFLRGIPCLGPWPMASLGTHCAQNMPSAPQTKIKTH